MLSAARIEQLYPIKTGMDSPNTKISRGNWSLVVVRKFIAEHIISYRNRNEHSGILLTNRDFHLQTGNLGYKTGLSFTNGDSWVTNGILGLLFTVYEVIVLHLSKICNIFLSYLDKNILLYCAHYNIEDYNIEGGRYYAELESELPVCKFKFWFS